MFAVRLSLNVEPLSKRYTIAMQPMHGQAPSPHPLDQLSFFRPHGVGIDGRGGKLRVAENILQGIERDAGADGLDAVAVAQSLGTGVSAVGDSGRRHDVLHDIPALGAAPVPEQMAAPSVGA